MAKAPKPIKNYSGTKEFKETLTALPLFAETGGGQIVKMPDGSYWIVGIGMTPIRENGGADEIIRRRIVTKAKAQAGVVEYLGGANVTATCVSCETTSIETKNGKEYTVTTENLDDVIISKAKGVVTKLVVLGTWTNSDETIYYQALGKKLK